MSGATVSTKAFFVGQGTVLLAIAFKENHEKESP